MARHTVFIAACGALVSTLPAPASAESASASLEVSLIVEPACRVSATPMSFAGRAGEPMDAASQITVACNDNTPVAVRLDGGLNADGGERHLAGDGGQIEYAVYADAARSLQWAPGEALTGSAGAVPLALSAYGRIDAGATAGALGSYRDTITVTVDF